MDSADQSIPEIFVRLIQGQCDVLSPHIIHVSVVFSYLVTYGHLRIFFIKYVW